MGKEGKSGQEKHIEGNAAHSPWESYYVISEGVFREAKQSLRISRQSILQMEREIHPKGC